MQTVYQAHKDLICELIQQAVNDAHLGDPGAIQWFKSRYLDYWCSWIDLDPVAVREAVLAKAGSNRRRNRPLSQEQIDKALWLKEWGLSIPKIAARLKVAPDYLEKLLAKEQTNDTTL